MATDISKKLKTDRYRSYLNKDFDSFKSDLLTYAKTYFPKNIQDFSDASMGGLLIELAAYVGDSLCFYLDHQFTETDIETAVEEQNIARMLRSAGVKIAGAAPASVYVDFYISVASEEISGEFIPKSINLPVIKSGTVVQATAGVQFELIDDIDFAEVDDNGDFLGEYVVPTGATDSDGNATSFIMKRTGLCVSGRTTTEAFNISSEFKAFRNITLSNQDVSEIISVSDSAGERYYEVTSLTQDVVFKRVINTSADSSLVSDNLELAPAPRRFIASASRTTGLTTLTFGSGEAETLDDDILPDPSEVALPLFGKQTFSRFSIDPNSLLRTRTLGISPTNTTITVKYRHGGGLNHNVATESITTIAHLKTEFNPAVSAATISTMRASTDVLNAGPAEGGESAPTLDELRSIAIAFRNSQSRIVSKEDLIARIYTMPSNFGRVYRVGIAANADNPLASIVYIISRDTEGALTTSPDSLKNNLRIYLNEFRLISDAVDILDAQVINYKIEYNVVIDSYSNKTSVIQNINANLSSFTSISNFQIDQPIVISDIQNIIQNTDGVISLSDIAITNIAGEVDGREYSDTTFNVDSNTDRGIIFPPSGGIFEIRYSESDIVGSSV
tara:strand:- start:2954 stop:4804 length:1851 start_codon:yes stop_codon:yes gene_type:complete